MFVNDWKECFTPSDAESYGGRSVGRNSVLWWSSGCSSARKIADLRPDLRPHRSSDHFILAILQTTGRVTLSRRNYISYLLIGSSSQIAVNERAAVVYVLGNSTALLRIHGWDSPLDRKKSITLHDLNWLASHPPWQRCIAKCIFLCNTAFWLICLHMFF